MSNVLFSRGLSEDFVNLPKDPNTLYFITDKHEIYLGGEVYSFKGIAVSGSGDFVSNVTYSIPDKLLTIHKSEVGSSASVTAAIQAALSQAIKTISTDRGSALAVDDTDPENVVIGLNIATGQAAGNVLLEQDSDGLKASVNIPEPPVLGVTSGEKVISLAESYLRSQISIGIDHRTEGNVNKTYVVLKGINNQVVSEFDAAEFVQDGMIESVDYDPNTHILHIRFNTDAGQDNRDVYINLTDLIDVYTAALGGGLALSNNAFSIANQIEPGSTQIADEEPGFGETVTLKSICFDSHGSITEVREFDITMPSLSGSVGESSSDQTLITYVKLDDSGVLQGSSIDLVTSLGNDDTSVPTSKAVKDAIDDAAEASVPVLEIFGS